MWQQRRLGKQVCHIPRGSYTAYARRRGASRAYLDVDHGCTLQMSISPHEQRRCLDTAPKGRLCVVRRSRGPLLRTSRASGIDWRAAAKRGVKGQARKSIECKQWVLQVGSPIGPMGCVRRRRGGEAVSSAAGRGAAWWMSVVAKVRVFRRRIVCRKIAEAMKMSCSCFPLAEWCEGTCCC